jgi:uncharacterized protein (UPF0332 family)
VEAQELRHSGDYGELHSVSDDEAREQIARAERFLALTERFLGPLVSARHILKLRGDKSLGCVIG